MKTKHNPPLGFVLPAEFVGFADRYDVNPIGLATRLLLKFVRGRRTQLILAPKKAARTARRNR
jgi:hypothetical protein